MPVKKLLIRILLRHKKGKNLGHLKDLVVQYEFKVQPDTLLRFKSLWPNTLWKFLHGCLTDVAESIWSL